MQQGLKRMPLFDMLAQAPEERRRLRITASLAQLLQLLNAVENIRSHFYRGCALGTHRTMTVKDLSVGAL